MKIYLTSDHHFFHKKIIGYCNRPFSSMEEMNEVMIEKWNKRVSDGDMVVHLGDFSLYKHEHTLNVVSQLNGDIILIKGNHDRRTRRFWIEEAGFKEYFKNDVAVSDNIILSHRPRRMKDVINLHGHVHNNLDRYHSKNCVNLSVEVWDYYPVSLDEIELLSEEDKKIIKDFFDSFIKINFGHLEL